MQLSVVTTLFQSAPYIEEFYRRVRTEAEKIAPDAEFIFVNDGSTDRSLEVALELQKQDARIRVVDLSRNFGHHKAMMTGLEHSQGDLVFLIDVDLEEPPEMLGTFFESLDREKADAVYGVQSPRHGPWLTRTLANLFYWAFELLSDYRIPPHSLTARLMMERGGAIVNIGSGCNKLAFPRLSSYTASKGGIETFTKVAAAELGQYKIRVNCVAPGAIEIERTKLEAGDYAGTVTDLCASCRALARSNLPRPE